MKRLILIRHGETDYTQETRFCGHEDIPLNKTGKREIEHLSRRLRRLKIDRVYSSDLKRALESAKTIFKDRRIIKRRGLREIDFGRLSGITLKEANILYPDVIRAMQDDPLAMKMPGGEGLADFAKRVTMCYKDIAGRNRGKVVAIVSHGGPIRIILLNLRGLSLDNFWKMEVDTATFHIIKISRRRRDPAMAGKDA